MNLKIRKIEFLFVIICIIQLLYIFHFRSGFRYEIIKNPFSENSGIVNSVSAEVIESKNIIKVNKLANFNLSNKLEEDPYFYQRFIEFNYPIRFNKKSKSIFYLLEEEIPNQCHVIQTEQYLKLIKC